MRKIILSFTFIVLSAGTVFGSGFSSLKFGGSARVGGMGMACTALADKGSAGCWNPANLAIFDKTDFAFSANRWFKDFRNEFIGFARGNDKNGVGVHLLYTEIGGIQQRIGPSPEPLSLFSAHEFIAGVSYARKINEQVSIGVTLKMFYEKIFIEEARGLGGDIGILWVPKVKWFRLGAVLQNLGKTEKLKDEKIQLPLTLRLGLAVPLEFLGTHWNFAIDGVKEQNFPFHLHLGMEYGWRGIFFLRCGYQTGYTNRSLTGGIGVVWGRYRLDYSYIPLHSGLQDINRFSITVEL